MILHAAQEIEDISRALRILNNSNFKIVTPEGLALDATQRCELYIALLKAWKRTVKKIRRREAAKIELRAAKIKGDHR